MYLIAGIVLILAFTLFRPLTTGLFRAAYLVVFPRKLKNRKPTMAKINELVASSTPIEAAFVVEREQPDFSK